jgi:hypothetical protein
MGRPPSKRPLRERNQEATQRYRLKTRGTPLSRYREQRASAQRRGIPFLLTFEEWWRIWEDSGHWAERGRQRGQYCMARHGDQGAYEVGNVTICLDYENGSAPRNEQTRKRLSKARAGKKLSEYHCKRMSEVRIGGRRVYLPDGSWTWSYPK